MKRIITALVLTAAVIVGSNVVAPESATADTGAVMDKRKPGGKRVKAVARVTVIDKTGGTWAGVADVVRGWNASKFVRAKMGTACRVRTYCVTLAVMDAGQVEWMGRAQPGATASTLELNSFYAQGDPFMQSAILCHEFGHALGIGHPKPGEDRPGVHGCIASTDASLTVATPAPADLAELLAIYRGYGNHNEVQGWGALYAAGLAGNYGSSDRHRVAIPTRPVR